MQKIAETKTVMQTESVVHNKHLTFSLKLVETDVEGFIVPHILKCVEACPSVPVQMAQVLSTFHETVDGFSH